MRFVRSGLVRRTATFVVLALVAGAAHRADAQRTRRSGFATDYRSRIDTTFAFDKAGSVSLRVSSGDITVTGTSAAQMHIRATSDDSNLRVDATSNRVMLEGMRGGDTKFEIAVPYGVRVIAYTQSGDVIIRGTRGEVEIHSQNGDIHVDDVGARLDINSLSGDITAGNIAGDVGIETTSGSVKLNEVRGNIDISSVSGDLTLIGVSAKVVRAKTTSGDVVFDGAIDRAGRYDLGTHSGDIRLHVPRDASAQLTVSSFNGGIESAFPITLRPGEHDIGSSGGRHFTFEIGGGAARISAETFSGDITISSNGRGAGSRR